MYTGRAGFAPDRVLVDARWIGPHGIGRVAREILSRLPKTKRVSDRFRLIHPVDPLWLSAEIRRHRAALFYSPGFNAPLWSSVPVVFTIHDLILVKFKDEVSLKTRAYFEGVLKPRIRRGRAHVVTVSEFSRHQIAEWAGVPAEQITVIHSGVGPPFTAEGEPARIGRDYLLYVGNHRPHKNVDRLLQAFARSGQAKDHVLVFAGTRNPETSARSADLGIGDRVLFSGPTPDEELAKLYRGATALIMPSLEEGFGLPALEAMACGTPVVVSPGALAELVGEAGCLIDPKNVDSIADAIDRLLLDGALRTELGLLGISRASNFSWDVAAQSVLALLETQTSTA